MQNWDTMQATANYEQHNTWYNNMFATHIKTEPGTDEPPPPPQPQPHQMPTTSQLEHYLKQHHQHQQQSSLVPMDTMSAMSTMTPSPSNADSMQHFFDSNMQQQLLQQQQYQQQFQHAQQAAAQNQLATAHLPLGFNPLTPPGLPTAVLPTMPHFYNPSHAASMRAAPQTPSPRPQTMLATAPVDASEKLQSALTPRNTPPMDVTPPKSPKPTSSLTTTVAAAVVAPTNARPSPTPSAATEKDHELLSNASEDMKYQRAESEDDESIRMPIYNSHGKMKNYKCKSCGMVAITKIAFWAHARTHMKPEKILQCPKCPFVTELKHHLEYHIRKHKNLKPFQCDKCSYTCVNKSMLNSHRKSHSSVYQYRCSDCDYATKYCHSFKLHLRKYEHQPGLVLDEEGLPNPSVVIDVYGTRRGPKTKSTSNANKRSHSGNGQSAERRSASSHNKPKPRERKMSTSQLSAALQSFAQHQLPSSPAKSTSSTASEFTSKMTLQHQQQLKQEQHQQQQQKQQQQQQNHQPTVAVAAPANPSSMPNLLPPLASILQQNRNMAFFPYWNLNLQMLAAQQQAVLAQLSPRVRDTVMQQLQMQQQHAERESPDSLHGWNEDDDDDDCERRSVDSAMDLSQGTPSKEDQPPQQHHHNTPPTVAMNLKLQDESNETPLNGKNGASRRKGRVLKLDALLQVKSASQSPEQIKELSALIAATNGGDASHRNASSPATAAADLPLAKIHGGHSAETEAEGDESMEASDNTTNAVVAVNNASPGHTTTSVDISASSAASSSGNSSNSSTNTNGFRPVRALYECKYCDIFFKDTVLYTIHMGYHSCDDVFKCNMCGEKCDGPVGLFVHMARNAHS